MALNLRVDVILKVLGVMDKVIDFVIEFLTKFDTKNA